MYGTRFRCWIFAWAFAAVLPLQAETLARGSSLRFEHLTIEHGLSQNTVMAIVQDRDGYMWLGTEDGLHRYDGYRFTVYRNDPEKPHSLSDNFITSIMQARDGAIWVGTGAGGVNRLDPASGLATRFQHDADDALSLGHDRVWAVVEDAAGRIWVATDSGLDRLDPAAGGFVHYRRDRRDPDGLASNLVRSLVSDHAGRLWIGTRAGLNFIEPGDDRVRRFAGDDAARELFRRAAVLAMHEDATGNLWVALSDRLARLSPSRDVTTVYAQAREDASPEAAIRAIVSDRAGNVWVGTDGGGLRRLPPTSMEFSVHRHDATNPASIASEQIFAAFEDETGLLWFGTGAGGVSRLNPATEAFAHYRRRGIDPAGLPSNTVWAFHEDPDGIVWVATDRGLARMDFGSGNITSFLIHPGAADPKSNAVYSVHRDGAGRLWAGAETGLFRFDEQAASFEKMDIFPTPDADAYAGTVTWVVQDDAGLLWLGTYNGLVRFDPNSGAAAIFNLDSGSVTSNWVMAVVPTSDGLWVGTEGGLNLVDPATGQLIRAWRNEPDNGASLSHNAVQTLALTRSGDLWIGTTAGLNRYDRAGDNFNRYTTADGLPSNYIYAVVEDAQDAIWISSNRGLARLNPESGEVESFSVSDGLQSNEFNSGAVHRGHSGRLYFGGINGFNRFHPKDIGTDAQPPRVGITGVHIMAGSFDSNVAASLPAALELAHDENVFRVEYAVFDYKSPAGNRFLYKLDGFDTEWRDGGTSNDATYTNLDPGHYLFRVRGGNSQGIWSGNEATLAIEITPPFTRSWTAYTIYAAIGLCIAGLLMRLWTERMRRENLLRVEQQKRGLAEHLQRFTQGITSTFDAGAVAEQLLGSAADIVTYDCGAVYVQDEHEARLLAAHKVDERERLFLERIPETNPEFFSGMRVLKARTISGTQLEASGFGQGMPQSAVLRYVPLVSHGRELGVMVLMRRYGPRFGVQDMSLCAILAQQAVVAFENARLFAEVQRLAVTDELTGLYNRRRFFELARQEFNRSLRHDSRLAMVILDADHFKRINDEHGHLTGDRVLAELARLCRGATRSFDVLGRYGGEELIIMLPETALATAHAVAARIRADVEASVTSSSHGTIQLTVSIGVAVRTLGMRDLSALVEAADNALFQAKREGRNRVVTAA